MDFQSIVVELEWIMHFKVESKRYNKVISIVTVVYNRVNNIENAILSVLSQNYNDVEYVVIDGGSTDGTLEVIENYRDYISVILSEPDRGIYDALNKGFDLASGDVVGILHSDDVFYNTEVLSDVAKYFDDQSVDFVYGDIEMVVPDGNVRRYWKAEPLINGRITTTQIPHPSLFLSSRLLTKLKPPFDSSFRISADLKQQLIIANIFGAKGRCISRPLVKMSLGGTSTSDLLSYIQGWIESRRAWNEVHGQGGFIYVLKKVFSKVKGVCWG